MKHTRTDNQHIPLTQIVFLSTAQCLIAIYDWHKYLEGGMPVRWVILVFIIIIETNLSSSRKSTVSCIPLSLCIISPCSFPVYSYYNAPEFHPFTRACLNFPNIYHFPTVSIKYCHLVLKYCVFQYVCIVSNVAFFINI